MLDPYKKWIALDAFFDFCVLFNNRKVLTYPHFPFSPSEKTC